MMSVQFLCFSLGASGSKRQSSSIAWAPMLTCWPICHPRLSGIQGAVVGILEQDTSLSSVSFLPPYEVC